MTTDNMQNLINLNWSVKFQINTNALVLNNLQVTEYPHIYNYFRKVRSKLISTRHTCSTILICNKNAVIAWQMHRMTLCIVNLLFSILLTWWTPEPPLLFVDPGPDMALHWGLRQGSPDQLHPAQDSGQPRPHGLLCLHPHRPGRYRNCLVVI